MVKLKLEHIEYTYNPGEPYQKKALTDINIEFESGKVTGVIGHTGSGKSTLMQLLNGLERPQSGRVLLDNKDIWEDPKNIRDIRFKVGLVMQYPEYQLFEETVAKDIAFGPRNIGVDESECLQRVNEAAKIVGLSAELLKKSPFELSGGEKRRASIAGVMAMAPEVLVLDEPAAGLDPVGRSTIFKAIENYRNETGATIIIVSHSMEDMAKICDNIVVMSKGKVLISGTTDEVFNCAELLIDNGLDIPEISKVFLMMKKRGLNIDKIPLTVEEAVHCFQKELVK